MSKVAKSLSELDALADEILSKSVDDGKEELKPEEISENVPDDSKDDDIEKDDIKDVGKKDSDDSDADDLEKCGNPDDVKKSDNTEPVEDVEYDEDDDEDLKKGEDSDDNTDDIAEDVENKEDLEKSIQSDFISEHEIKKGIEASEFLSSVVEIISKSLADAAGEIQINRADNKHNTAIIAKSLQAALSMNKSMAEEISDLKKENAELKKSITDGFTTLQSSLEDVLSQPTGMRKSVKNIQVMDRNFQKSLNGNVGSGIETLSKSQIMDILVTEMHSGNAAVTANDIVAYESGAPLHSGLIALVNSKCK
jgi:hypothetical protein